MEVLNISQLLPSLAGPGAAVVVLCIVLYGVYRLIDKLVTSFLDKFGTHLQSIEGKFDKLGESMDSLAKDFSALRVIVEKQELKLDYELEAIKVRLDKLEKERA